MPVVRAGKLKNLKSRLENGTKRGLILAANLQVKRARKNAPVKTGKLRDSIVRSNPKKSKDGKWFITIGSDLPYADAQEFGSGLHATRGPKKKIKISAKNALALAFKWPNAPSGLKPGSDGKFRFKHVHHPGVKPKHFIEKARVETLKDVVVIIGKAIAGTLTRG